MEFHEKLQELRKQKKLTQEELAASLYVSRTTISKWESGRGYPNIDSLKALAQFFGVTIDELLSGDELLTIAQEDNKRVETHFRDLVFGLLDCSVASFFFLPFFGQNFGWNLAGSFAAVHHGALALFKNLLFRNSDGECYLWHSDTGISKQPSNILGKT